MYAAGVRAVVEPSFWLGQPRTSVGSFVRLLRRAARVGAVPGRAVRHPALRTIGLNPKEANDPRCRAVLDVLPRYLDKDGVVAVGEIGYDSMTTGGGRGVRARSSRWRSSTTCPRSCTPRTATRPTGTRRTLDVVRESGLAARPGARRPPQRGDRRGVVADSGCWMGFSIYPDTKMDAVPDGRDPQGARHRADARQLGRRLGPQRPAPDRARPPRRCSPAASTTTTSTACCGATPSSSTARAAASISTDGRQPRRGRPSRATRAPRVQGRLTAPPARRRHRRAPRLLHQRAPGRGPRRRARANSTASRGRCVSSLGATCSGSGLWLAAPAAPRSWPATPPAPTAAASTRRARARGGDAQRLSRTGRFQRRVVKRASTGPTGPSRSASSTRSTAPRCWPTCCPTTLRRGSISTLPLGLARRRGIDGRPPTRRRTALGRLSDGSQAHRADDRPSRCGWGSSRSPGLRRRDRRRRRSSALAGVDDRPDRRLPRRLPPRRAVRGPRRGACRRIARGGLPRA